MDGLTKVIKITLKEDAPPEELQKAKDKAKSEGGVIKHEFTLIKGFTYDIPSVIHGKHPLTEAASSSQTTKSVFFRPMNMSTLNKMV